MRVIGLAGWSGAGKTTLLARLIPELVGRGFRVSTVKHAHHGFDVDQPGKDSHTHRISGASEVLVGSGRRWVLMHELRGEPEPGLDRHLRRLSPCDLVLVEGFKRQLHPKIEVHRLENGKPWLHPDVPNVLAVVTDAPRAGLALPSVHIDDIAGVADLVLVHARPIAEVLERIDGHAPAE